MGDVLPQCRTLTPPPPAASLDEGVERLAVYNEKIAEIVLQKEELTNAQLLFGLEVPSCPTHPSRCRTHSVR